MLKVATSLSLLLLAGACAGPAPQPQQTRGAAHQLAVACAIDVEVATAALAGTEAEPLPLPPGPVPDPVPDPGPGPVDPDPGLPMVCCTDPDGCTPMDYPDDICQTMPTPAEATTLALHSIVPYTGDGTTTAFFANCEPPPDEECEETDAPYVFVPYPQTRWVAAFTEDAAGNAFAELYQVPAGTGAVKLPSGAQPFPLLEATEGYADPTRPVATPDGTLYVDKQNDCIPREDGCGFTCYTC